MTADKDTPAPRDASGKQAQRIEQDARGQFVGTQHGGENDGVVSAKPTVITGSQDATVNKWNPDKTDLPDDWDANFDMRDQDKS
jgi:hypothetical protein